MLSDTANSDYGGANALPTCSVYGFQMGMILLFFGGLVVEVVGCACLGVRGGVCVGLWARKVRKPEMGVVMEEGTY